jgi:hypothetical protein
MPEEKNSVEQIMLLKFEDIKPVVYKENKVRGWFSYGEKNDYPAYLLDLFDKSGKHGAIVRGKTDFIIGNGFGFVDDNLLTDTNAKTIIDRCNSNGESLEDVTKKVAMDVEIFGGGYFQVIYNRKKKISEIYHLDFSNVRTNKARSKFWFSEEWIKIDANGNVSETRNPEVKELEPFNPAKPGGEQVLYIGEYTPGNTPYPKPNYNAAIRYIQIDICIGEYHLNGITNGMFASKMINFNSGVPGLPEQKEIENKVNRKFAGSKNAGKIMLSFNKDAANSPTVTDLSGTELDKHFDLLNETTETQIFSSHRVTSGSLFGIKSKGVVFANNNELRQAFELFQNTYCNAKRKLLEKSVNLILSINDVPTVYLQRSEPVGVQFSEATIAKALTEDEIRETLGRKPKTQEQSKETPAANAEVSLSKLDDERDITVFAKFGASKTGFEVLNSEKVVFTNDFQFSRHYFDAVGSLTKNQRAIIDLLNGNKSIDVKGISDVLEVSEDVIKGLLKSMESDGLIKVSTSSGSIERTPTAEAIDILNRRGNAGEGDKTSVKVMYSYEGVKDDRNRPFCAKMLELDRFYTREDIEAISEQLGYSVWHRRGGWYKPKGETEARPYCRHYWQTNTVITKST